MTSPQIHSQCQKYHSGKILTFYIYVFYRFIDHPVSQFGINQQIFFYKQSLTNKFTLCLISIIHQIMKGHKKGKQNRIDVKLGYSDKIITDPLLFYQTFKNDKAVKFNQNPHPFLKDVTIIDIVLAGRGFEEDTIYQQFPYYRNNVRRGNTLLKIGEEVYWLRKGLRKFFDLRADFLSGEVKGDHSHYAIFRQIENVLSCSDFVEKKDQPICYVWKLLKANGQNSQISFSKELNMWSISSKNVSIVVKDQKDLDKYKDQRYNFATLIARCFFKILQKNNYTPAQLQELSNILANKTLIGEYCGNPDCQHIVKYAEETILFYAIVDNSSQDTCLPPPIAGEIFKRLNLPVTNDFQKSLMGKFQSYDQLMKALRKLFQEVSSSTLDSEEEGAVIYFGLEVTEGFYKDASQRKLGQRFPIPQKPLPVTLKVSSLGKLKTLQYRLLRKLRQKLKRYVSPQKINNIQQSYKSIFSKFVRQSKQLIGQSQMKTSFEYYQLIALYSLFYISKNIKSIGALDLMRTAYIDFLSVIMYCIEKNVQPTFEMMTDSGLIESLRKVSWSQYNTNVKEQFQKQIQRFYPHYKKMQENKSIQKQGSSSQEDPDRE